MVLIFWFQLLLTRIFYQFWNNFLYLFCLKPLVNEEGVHSLLIAPASFADAGVYTCVARNKVGEASFDVEVRVVNKDAHIAPFFIEHLRNVVIPEGKDTVLSCTCSGTPQPTISWEKDGHPLVPDRNYRIDVNGGHARLFITNAQKKDEGWYQCTATNSAGTNITRTTVQVLRNYKSLNDFTLLIF